MLIAFNCKHYMESNNISNIYHQSLHNLLDNIYTLLSKLFIRIINYSTIYSEEEKYCNQEYCNFEFDHNPITNTVKPGNNATA